jgi:asparagine synthase (glutamine-hydrolysing)
MCGITGFISTRPGPGARTLLQGMSDRLVHRGPDGAGWYLNGERSASSGECSSALPQVGLAMRRLAIIDLSTGHQPIANEDETCWIVFNGEIYNHRELRRELEAKGHRFRTASDTEAILHAYEEYGVACVHQLRGMFAFALWDSRQERLFLARDPVGIKPLYYTQTGCRFLFASEIKALLQDPDVPRRVNREGLHHYLTYLYVPAPQTMFEGISQLPPGHRLIWQRGTVTVEEYWAGPAGLLETDAGALVSPDELWSVLRESVGAHMLSDVPLGAFLSGGLDSTAIVAAMAELSARPVRTFSIGFEAAGLYNELAFAREAAQALRTEHQEFVVTPDAIALLPEVIRSLDEPLADASVIPNYLVARLARQTVTVALTGIGGDELFGGYRRYYGDALARRWQRIPPPVRRHVLLPALRRVPASDDTPLGEASRLAQKFLEPLDLAPEARYLAWNAFFSEAAKSELYQDRSEHQNGSSAALMSRFFDRVAHRPFADRAMYVDLKSYLPGDPLFLSDRMTMANSLEARVPLLDPKLMEFAARIPLEQKIQGRTTKAILRRALAGRVPDRLIHRPKRGFGTPIDLWLRRELAPLADQLLSPRVLRERGYFRPEYVVWLREQQAAGRRDFSQHLWALLVFELWHRAYIDADRSSHKGLTFEELDLSWEQGSLRCPVLRPSPPVPSPQRAVRRGKSSSSLRILMVADVDPVRVMGGAERMLSEHSRRLAARGHRVVVLTRAQHPALPLEEEWEGVRVVRHPVSGVGAIGFVRSVLREGGAAFSRLMAQEPFDLINIHQPLAACAALGRDESRRVPVLYTYLSPWSHEYGVRAAQPDGSHLTVAARRAWIQANTYARQRMEGQALERSDRLLVLSEFSTAQLRDIHGISAPRIRVIPGGVDPESFRPPSDRARLRRELQLPGGPLLLTVRNLVPRMGLDTLIDSMQAVVQVRPDCQLLIGGAGYLRAELEAQVRRLDLERNITFVGFIPEDRLADYYGAADGFILPTRCLEGFGLVTVEALACGTPVLGTPVGGTQEILRGFEPRFLFRSTDAGAIAERILEWLPALVAASDLRDRCRRYAVGRYSWDVLVPQVEALMAQMTGSSEVMLLSG